MWTIFLILLAAILPVQAQSWQVPFTDRHIQMDGRLDDWHGIPKMTLTPGASGVRSKGSFAEQDVRMSLQGCWTKKALYFAVQWQDDSWDVENVPRSQAIWVSPDGRRRNRMMFFDHFNLFIQRGSFSYTAWISPRAAGRGPFAWSKQFGDKGLEDASSPPLISTTVDDQGLVTLELLFRWKDLRLKPKNYKDLRFQIVVHDSDWPSTALETKIDKLKSLSWSGFMMFGKKK